MTNTLDINGLTIVALSVLLYAVVRTDIKIHQIPNIMVIAIIFLGLVSQLLLDGVAGVIDWAAGIAVGTVFLLPFYVGGGMAAGDVKLLAAIGSILGPLSTLVAGGIALLAGLPLALIAVLHHRHGHHKNMRVSLEGTPHLVAREETEVHWSKLRVPYAMAIAAGAYGGLWHSGQLQQFIGAILG
ncbi:MAG: A24 family peptidase [Gammaproteobacteria bacterium]|jgi:prepilin peptidase CpaA